MSIGFKVHNDRIVRGNRVCGQRLSGDLPHSASSSRGTHQRPPLASLSQVSEIITWQRLVILEAISLQLSGCVYEYRCT